MALPFNFQARNARTTADLHDLIEEKSADKACAVADLTLGAWLPHSLETQWLGQILRKDLAFKGGAAPLADILSLGEAMCASIDEEGRGNRGLIAARTAARQLARVLSRFPTALIVLVPCFGVAWRNDDVLLLEYLLEIDPVVDLTFAIAGDLASAWPRGWNVVEPERSQFAAVPCSNHVLYAVPSAISSTVLQRLVDPPDLLRLANGWALVPPEQRGYTDTFFSATKIAALKQLGLEKLIAYALLHGIGVTVDPWQLCLEAWQQCHSGYRELGLMFVAAAEVAATDPVQKIVLKSHKQAMRIATMHYRDAAAEEDPPEGVPAALSGMLFGFKGWGLVMEGRASDANHYLEKALMECKPDKVDKAYLFLKNISALGQLRCGSHDAALRQEIEIEAAIEELDRPAYELVFVNSLNLARLYRYSADFERAERQYHKAFATFDGARTETDAVNENLCLGRLAEDRGQYDVALLCWVRAALQWCANDCPEALNWRVQALVIGNRRAIVIDGWAAAQTLVESLALGFLENLTRFAGLCGIEWEQERRDATELPFTSTDVEWGQLQPLRYIGGDGWAVLAAGGKMAARDFGASYRALVRWLNAWIQLKAGRGHEVCYVIDRRDGREMPINRTEMVSSAADFAVGSLTYGDASFELGREQLAAMRDALGLRISSLVARIEEDGSVMVVHFKRYLRPVRLMADELVVFQAIQKGQGYATLRTLGALSLAAGRIAESVASLRTKHVIQTSALAEDPADLRDSPSPL